MIYLRNECNTSNISKLALVVNLREPPFSNLWVACWMDFNQTHEANASCCRDLGVKQPMTDLYVFNKGTFGCAKCSASLRLEVALPMFGIKDEELRGAARKQWKICSVHSPSSHFIRNLGGLSLVEEEYSKAMTLKRMISWKTVILTNYLQRRV